MTVDVMDQIPCSDMAPYGCDASGSSESAIRVSPCTTLEPEIES